MQKHFVFALLLIFSLALLGPVPVALSSGTMGSGTMGPGSGGGSDPGMGMGGDSYNHPMYDTGDMMLDMPMVQVGNAVYNVAMEQIPGTMDFAVTMGDYMGSMMDYGPDEVDAHFDLGTMMLTVDHVQVGDADYMIQMHYSTETHMFRATLMQLEDTTSTP